MCVDVYPSKGVETCMCVCCTELFGRTVCMELRGKVGQAGGWVELVVGSTPRGLVRLLDFGAFASMVLLRRALGSLLSSWVALFLHTSGP